MPHGAPTARPFDARRVHLLPRFCRVPTDSAGDLLVLIEAVITAIALSLLSTHGTAVTRYRLSGALPVQSAGIVEKQDSDRQPYRPRMTGARGGVRISSCGRAQ